MLLDQLLKADDAKDYVDALRKFLKHVTQATVTDLMNAHGQLGEIHIDLETHRNDMLRAISSAMDFIRGSLLQVEANAFSHPKFEESLALAKDVCIFINKVGPMLKLKWTQLDLLVWVETGQQHLGIFLQARRLHDAGESGEVQSESDAGPEAYCSLKIAMDVNPSSAWKRKVKVPDDADWDFEEMKERFGIFDDVFPLLIIVHKEVLEPMLKNFQTASLEPMCEKAITILANLKKSAGRTNDGGCWKDGFNIDDDFDSGAAQTPSSIPTKRKGTLEPQH